MNNSCPDDIKDRGIAPGCKGCPSAKICSSSKLDEDIPIIKERLSSIKMAIAVMSGKGGVGKSTIAFNLAYSMAKLNKNVVLVDFDLSGPSIPRLSGTMDISIDEPRETFNPIIIFHNKDIKNTPSSNTHFNTFSSTPPSTPSSNTPSSNTPYNTSIGKLAVISVKHLTDLQYDHRVIDSDMKNKYIKCILKNCDFTNYDTMIIDTPPNITDEHLALAHLVQLKYSILVSGPSILSYNDLRRTLSFCKKAKINIIGMIENQKWICCPHCNGLNELVDTTKEVESDKENGRIFCSRNNIDYLCQIPFESKIAKSSDEGILNLIGDLTKISVSVLEKYFQE